MTRKVKKYISREKPTDQKTLIHKFDNDQASFQQKKIIGAAVIIIIGILTGYVLSVNFGRNLSEGKKGELIYDKNGKIVGSKDEKTFSDEAEGVIEAGGINGEGTHKLKREGGESQTVYLTSSVLNLDEFVGKKVRVWGETFSAQKAGWLMDVGRVEILD